MTLVLSERQVESMVDMGDVVRVVEDAFKHQSTGEAVNSPRTRSRAPGAVLNVMHANLSYLGRGGAKLYMSSPKGTRFVFVLFDMKDSSPLAVMGAEVLGRFRTGAASGVATKHLYRQSSGKVAILGSGKQALTQALALASVIKIEEARVWSPDPDHRAAFSKRLERAGMRSTPCDTPDLALRGAQVGSSITSSPDPFITKGSVDGLSHLNICGGNNPEHSEIYPDAIGAFDTIAVDDLPQAKMEYGDLIQAAASGMFSWDAAVQLKDVVGGGVVPKGKTLFKSGGAALEDVALASALYDMASKSGVYPDVDLGFD